MPAFLRPHVGPDPIVRTASEDVPRRESSTDTIWNQRKSSVARIHAARAEVIDVLHHDDSDFDRDSDERKKSQTGWNWEMRTRQQKAEKAAQRRKPSYGQDEANPCSSVTETMGNSNARRQPKKTIAELRADADCRRHTRRAGNARISHSRLRSNSILGLNQSPSTVVEIVSATFGRCRIKISTATLQPKY